MGALGTAGKIILFPFKLIFVGGKKKETGMQESLQPPQLPTSQYAGYTPEATTTENLKAKVDLMLAQIDSMKIEYDAINQRIQNIERMVRELYTMAKS